MQVDSRHSGENKCWLFPLAPVMAPQGLSEHLLWVGARVSGRCRIKPRSGHRLAEPECAGHGPLLSLSVLICTMGMTMAPTSDANKNVPACSVTSVSLRVKAKFHTRGLALGPYLPQPTASLLSPHTSPLLFLVHILCRLESPPGACLLACSSLASRVGSDVPFPARPALPTAPYPEGHSSRIALVPLLTCREGFSNTCSSLSPLFAQEQASLFLPSRG